MISALSLTLLGAGLALAAWTGLQAWLRRPVNAAQIVVAGLLELALLTQTVIALIRMPGMNLTEPVTFAAYAIGVLAPLPIGIWAARIERTRWGSIALCFTAVVVAVMSLRLHQLGRAGA